jgi:hypothetical protein
MSVTWTDATPAASKLARTCERSSEQFKNSANGWSTPARSLVLMEQAVGERPPNLSDAQFEALQRLGHASGKERRLRMRRGVRVRLGDSEVLGRRVSRRLAPRGLQAGARHGPTAQVLAVARSLGSVVGVNVRSTVDASASLAHGPPLRPDQLAHLLSVKMSWVYEAVRSGRCHAYASAGISASRARCSRSGLAEQPMTRTGSAFSRGHCTLQIALRSRAHGSSDRALWSDGEQGRQAALLC